MPARDSKPPKGKVRPKTPVPTSRRPQEPGAPRTRRGLGRAGVIVVPVVAVLLAIGVGIMLGVRSSRTADDVATPTVATTETTPARTAPVAAKDLFGQSCASCHTLAAAGSTAGIGPNLDEARPTRGRVLSQIRNGSLSGAMPANLLVGTDAERVAVYVSGVAGR